MIESLKKINDLDRVLSKLDDDELNQLYLRVFSSKDGELVMQDMANRSYVFAPTENEKQEGMRAAWLSIQTRLRNAVNPEKKEA
jgi:hypothetical protein